MKAYKADIHIHTVLSHCADLEMSPVNIVNRAAEKELSIIGVCDHNSTLQCNSVKTLADKKGIMTLMGVEVTSSEEVHCLAFFETDESREEFERYIELNQPVIKNEPNIFGYQLLVD